MKNNDQVFLTKDGLKKFQEEHQLLVGQKRKEIAKRIKSARELGDLSENAEYHSAKEEQAFIEGRIKELEHLLKNAQVAKGPIKKNVVGVGSKVKIHIDSTEEVFEVVGAQEADPASNKVSYESPLGQALVGKKAGDKFEVDAPAGKLVYSILEIL